MTGATTLGTGGLSVTGATSLEGLSASTGAFTGNVSAANGSFSGTLSASGTTTLGALSAGSSTLSSLAVTNNATVGGTLGVTGASTLGTVTAGSSTISGLIVNGTTYLGGNTATSNGLVQIGTSVSASGTSSALLTVGKAVSGVYPFSVDQYGNVAGNTFTGTTFTGNLVGSQSGGSVAATTLSASGAATLSSTLSVTGATNLSAALTGTSASFSGNVSAASFTGSMTIGGGGVTMSGVVPIANGGTGQTTAANALSSLFSNAGTISQMIPGADLVNNSVTSTQLNTTGVAAGTYSSVTVGADGRVTAGTGSGGQVSSINDGSGDSVTVGTSAITYAIGSSTVGNWTSAGLMVGSSKTALDTLDVYGGVAIGTGFAGTYSAPTNGLIVQGNVAIGTSTANGALNVNGTINATSFVGSGAGLTGVGSGTVTSSNAGQVAYFQSTGTTVVGTSTITISGGQVGIGTTSPAALLDVNASNAVGGVIDLNNRSSSLLAGNTAGVLNFVSNTGFTTGTVGSISSQAINNGQVYALIFSTYGLSDNLAERMRVDNVGNVIIGGVLSGIGPYGKNLGVTNSASSSSAGLSLYNTTPSTTLDTGISFVASNGYWEAARIAKVKDPNGNNAAGDLVFYTAPTTTGVVERMRIDLNGNVGIGTAAPQSLLEVYAGEVQVGSSAASCAAANGGAIRFSGSTLYYCDGSSTWQTLYGSGGSSGVTTGSGAANNMALWTNATALGTSSIYQSGSNVGIGTASPQALLETNAVDNTTTTIPLNFGTTTTNAYIDNAASLTTITAPVNTATTAANLNYVIVNPTSAPTSATVYGRYDYVTIPSTATNTSTSLIGDYVQARNYGSSSPSTIEGMGITSYQVGIGTTTNNYGVIMQTGILSNGSNQTAAITNQYAFYNSVLNSSTNGTITNRYGIYTVANNSGTVVEDYGVYISGFTTGTHTNTPHDIYAADTGAYNYFGGNVGIGSTAPVNALDVSSGGIHIGSSVPSNTTAALYNNGGTLMWNGSAVGGASLSGGVANYMAYWTSATAIGTANVYYSGGNVGIGTATVANTLDVNGNASIGYNVAAPSNGLIVSGNVGIGTTAPWSGAALQARPGTNEDFAISGPNLMANGVVINSYNDAVSANEDLEIRAANVDFSVGNVGIGTTGPGERFVVSDGTSDTTSNSSLAEIDSTNNNAAALRFIHPGVVEYTAGIDTSNNLRIVNTNGAAAVSSSSTGIIMNSSGSVGIGTTAPQAALDVFDSWITPQNNVTTTTSAATGISWHMPNPTAYGIYRTSGSWSSPNYQQLELQWQTGIVINGGSSYGLSGTVLQPSGGNVGIGTTVPANTLQIGSMTGYSGNQFAIGNGTGEFAIAYPSNNPTFYTNNNFVFMGSGGNGYVGIGTTAPIAGLDVYSNASQAEYTYIRNMGGGGAFTILALGNNNNTAQVQFILTASANNSYAGPNSLNINNNGGNIAFDINSSEAMRITTAGNVGIGSTAPQAPLDIQGQLSFSGNSGQSGSVNRIATQSNTGWMTINSPGGLYLNNMTTSTVSISSDGGATTVGGTLQTSGGVGIRNSPTGYSMWVGESSGNNTWTAIFNWPPPSDSSYGILVGNGSGYSQFQNSSGYYIQLADSSWGAYSNGNMYAADFEDGACGCWMSTVAAALGYSDSRLKINVGDLPVESGLNAIMKLHPVTFRWKDEEKNRKEGLQIGFVAQEMQKVFPQVVQSDPHPVTIKTAKGGEKIENPETIKYQFLVAPLVKAVQQLKANNDNLRVETDELRREIVDLKRKNRLQ